GIVIYKLEGLSANGTGKCFRLAVRFDVSAFGADIDSHEREQVSIPNLQGLDIAAAAVEGGVIGLTLPARGRRTQRGFDGSRTGARRSVEFDTDRFGHAEPGLRMRHHRSGIGVIAQRGGKTPHDALYGRMAV